jgi:hypothetical protein
MYKSSQVGYEIVSIGGVAGKSQTVVNEIHLFQSLAPSTITSALTGMGSATDIQSYPSVIKDGIGIYKDLTQSSQNGSGYKGK